MTFTFLYAQFWATRKGKFAVLLFTEPFPSMRSAQSVTPYTRTVQHKTLKHVSADSDAVADRLVLMRHFLLKMARLKDWYALYRTFCV